MEEDGASAAAENLNIAQWCDTVDLAATHTLTSFITMTIIKAG